MKTEDTDFIVNWLFWTLLDVGTKWKFALKNSLESLDYWFQIDYMYYAFWPKPYSLMLLKSAKTINLHCSHSYSYMTL